MAGQNVCYFCQQPGHYANQCPKRQYSSRMTQQGKVFAMTHEEVQKSPGIIRGMILINENPICAMFDTGASHSFISDLCAEKLRLRVHELPYDRCLCFFSHGC